MGAKREYKNAFDAAVKIVKGEGPTALFKGLSPALLRQSTYGSMRYGFYTPIKKVMGMEDPKNVSLWKKVVAGSLAGAVSSAMCNPTVS